MITLYIEALLQGHYCYWNGFGTVETGFRILRRMCPGLFEHFAVKVIAGRICTTHIHYRTQHVNALRLSLLYQTDYIEKTGILMCETG